MLTYLTTENILCLLCGSLVATVFFYILTLRRIRLDNHSIRKLRRSEYLRGWQDGKDAFMREPID